MRLRTRMAMISAAAVAVVVVIAVFMAQVVARGELMREIDESLIERAEDIERFPFVAFEFFRADFQGRGGNLGPDSPFGRGATGFDALYVQVLNAEGQSDAPNDQTVELPISRVDLNVAARTRPRALRTVANGDVRIRMITSPLPGGAIQIGRSLREVDETLAGVTGTLTFAGAIGVALAGVLGLVVARSALRPVDKLTKTVEHVAETRELAARIDIERDDEIGRLAQRFNEMLEALEASRSQQQQLVRDAGHELRTPLTALRTNIELLERADSLSEAQRRELLDAATFELRELTDLTAELVSLAADPSGETEPFERVELDDLVGQVVDRFRRRIPNEIELLTEPAAINGQVAALDRAVSNLLDNAHKWSPETSPITVEVTAGGKVSVIDHGPGIATFDRERVFDRFYRADAARTTPGSGLGLAIVRKVIEDHRGSVFVEETPGGGATVGFKLPVAKSAIGS